jgi:hypothetical protein
LSGHGGRPRHPSRICGGSARRRRRAAELRAHPPGRGGRAPGLALPRPPGAAPATARAREPALARPPARAARLSVGFYCISAALGQFRVRRPRPARAGAAPPPAAARNGCRGIWGEQMVWRALDLPGASARAIACLQKTQVKCACERTLARSRVRSIAQKGCLIPYSAGREQPWSKFDSKQGGRLFERILVRNFFSMPLRQNRKRYKQEMKV